MHCLQLTTQALDQGKDRVPSFDWQAIEVAAWERFGFLHVIRSWSILILDWCRRVLCAVFGCGVVQRFLTDVVVCLVQYAAEALAKDRDLVLQSEWQALEFASDEIKADRGSAHAHKQRQTNTKAGMDKSRHESRQTEALHMHTKAYTNKGRHEQRQAWTKVDIGSANALELKQMQSIFCCAFVNLPCQWLVFTSWGCSTCWAVMKLYVAKRLPFNQGIVFRWWDMYLHIEMIQYAAASGRRLCDMMIWPGMFWLLSWLSIWSYSCVSWMLVWTSCCMSMLSDWTCCESFGACVDVWFYGEAARWDVLLCVGGVWFDVLL